MGGQTLPAFVERHRVFQRLFAAFQPRHHALKLMISLHFVTQRFDVVCHGSTLTLMSSRASLMSRR